MEDDNKLRYWKVPYPLTGNGFFFGRTDSGKSWKMLAIAQGYHSMGYKLWQFFGGKRKESCFWCFPSEETKLWGEFEKEVGRMSQPGPKEYKVNILTFMFSTTLENKVPEMLPRITNKIVTIPFRKIKTDDISLVIGPMASNSIYVWNQIIKHTDKNSTGEDIRHLFNTKLKKYKDLSIYKNFIEPAIDNHLFASENCPLNIDLIAEAKEKDVITVLQEDNIPEGFKWFIPNYLISNIMELAMDEKIHKRNIGVCQEVSSFMKVQDKNAQFAEQTQIFRNKFSDIARYARSGLFLFADCQSPSEVKGLISGQDDLTGINEMPSARDRQELCEQLIQDRRMTSTHVRYIQQLKIYEMIVVCRKENARIVKRVMPPRNQCWKPTLANFNNYWKQKYNSYKDSRKELSIIEEEYGKALFEIEQKLKIEAMKKQAMEGDETYEDDEELNEEVNKESSEEVKNEDDLEIVNIKDSNSETHSVNLEEKDSLLDNTPYAMKAEDVEEESEETQAEEGQTEDTKIKTEYVEEIKNKVQENLKPKKKIKQQQKQEELENKLKQIWDC